MRLKETISDVFIVNDVCRFPAVSACLFLRFKVSQKQPDLSLSSVIVVQLNNAVVKWAFQLQNAGDHGAST